MSSKQKPKLGQNFLVDERAREAVAAALGDTKARAVLEIGPGHGALTGLLATRCRRLILVEVDPSLAAELRFRYRNSNQVEVIEADFLQLDLVQTVRDDQTIDVIGNLPYYITSDILLKLFSASRTGLIRRAVLMMQREVADRVAAHPGVREYGLLSATAQLHARIDKLFTLPPDAFSPPPDVYSTVIRLEFAARFAELGLDPDEIDVFLHKIFAQKRKTLRNNLRASGWSSEAIAAAWPICLSPEIRAETLSIDEIAALFHRLHGVESTS
jgi:16S rRNA (adenine1518-N6/adenine1519-N6)-dimethyltransferase